MAELGQLSCAFCHMQNVDLKLCGGHKSRQGIMRGKEDILREVTTKIMNSKE